MSSTATTPTYESDLLQHPAYEQAMQKRWAEMPPERAAAHIQRQLRGAHIPRAFRDCCFDRLDPARGPETHRLCRAYAETGRHGDLLGLLLAGQPGTGKTSLAIAVLRGTVEQQRGRFSARYWNVPQGLDQIRQSFGDDDRPSESVLDIARNRLVVLDDLGKHQMTPWVAAQFYTLIDVLWAECRQAVITTNLSLAALRRALDPAVMSRILGMCALVPVKGQDMRISTRRST